MILVYEKQWEYEEEWYKRRMNGSRTGCNSAWALSPLGFSLKVVEGSIVVQMGIENIDTIAKVRHKISASAH